MSNGSDTKLWRAGQPANLPEPAPLAMADRLFVTAKNTIVGTYNGSDFFPHGAEWTCA